MLRKIFYLFGPKSRRRVRRLYYMPSDIINKWSGKRAALVPPTGMIFTGGGDFVRIGDEFLERFIKNAKLEPHHRVLDVGCGIGRMARPLAGFLSGKGSYEGFDIVSQGVRWCNKEYKDYPNFNFRHLPLKNDLYNLSHHQEAEEFSFPYPDNEFNLVFMISVFTHMQAGAVARYLSETSRVLKKGSRCLCTFFVITPESDNFLQNSPNPFFRYRYDDFYLHDNKVKDANIAFKYPALERMAEDAGLKIVSFLPGWWASSERQKKNDFQDIIVFEK